MGKQPVDDRRVPRPQATRQDPEDGEPGRLGRGRDTRGRARLCQPQPGTVHVADNDTDLPFNNALERRALIRARRTTRRIPGCTGESTPPITQRPDPVRGEFMCERSR